MAITLGALYVTELTAQRLNEPAPMVKAFVVSVALYGLPALFVAIGGYAHDVKRQPWARLLVIAASLFLTVWFFLSLVVLVWSAWVLPIVLLTAFAIFTSLISLIV